MTSVEYWPSQIGSFSFGLLLIPAQRGARSHWTLGSQSLSAPPIRQSRLCHLLSGRSWAKIDWTWSNPSQNLDSAHFLNPCWFFLWNLRQTWLLEADQIQNVSRASCPRLRRCIPCPGYHRMHYRHWFASVIARSSIGLSSISVVVPGRQGCSRRFSGSQKDPTVTSQVKYFEIFVKDLLLISSCRDQRSSSNFDCHRQKPLPHLCPWCQFELFDPLK